MDSLNLLRELESHNLILVKSRYELEELRNNSDIIEAEKRQKDIESRYDNQRSRLENIIEKIRKSENLLKNHEFQHKEKKKLLYKGNLIDIKQLEQLDREEKEIKHSIDSMESEIIESLQEVDLMEKELEEMKIEILLMREIIENQKSEIKKRIVELEGIIFKETDYISTMSSKIDKTTFDVYEKIRKHKLDVIVAVKDDICTGCNMRIPSHQKKPLSEGQAIVICESCGRMLYKEDEEFLPL